MARYQFTETGAVDIRSLRQVQQDLPVASGNQVPHAVAHHVRPFAESDTAGNIDHGHIVHLTGVQLQAHEISVSFGRFIPWGWIDSRYHLREVFGLPATMRSGSMHEYDIALKNIPG